MARNMGSERTDVHALSMSYHLGQLSGAQLKSGAVGLATVGAKGEWIKTAHGRFVYGPWNAGYQLGTYGIDAATNSAWAVIDYNGTFAVANQI
jgi:hypothetical protein